MFAPCVFVSKHFSSRAVGCGWLHRSDLPPQPPIHQKRQIVITVTTFPIGHTSHPYEAVFTDKTLPISNQILDISEQTLHRFYLHESSQILGWMSAVTIGRLVSCMKQIDKARNAKIKLNFPQFVRSARSYSSLDQAPHVHRTSWIFDPNQHGAHAHRGQILLWPATWSKFAPPKNKSSGAHTPH